MPVTWVEELNHIKYLHCLTHGKYSINGYSYFQSTNSFSEHLQEGMRLTLMLGQISEDSFFASFLSQLKGHFPREAFPDPSSKRWLSLSHSLSHLQGWPIIPVCLDQRSFLGCRSFCAKSRTVLGILEKSVTLPPSCIFSHDLCHSLILFNSLVCFLISLKLKVSPLRGGSGFRLCGSQLYLDTYNTTWPIIGIK